MLKMVGTKIDETWRRRQRRIVTAARSSRFCFPARTSRIQYAAPRSAAQANRIVAACVACARPPAGSEGREPARRRVSRGELRVGHDQHRRCGNQRQARRHRGRHQSRRQGALSYRRKRTEPDQPLSGYAGRLRSFSDVKNTRARRVCFHRKLVGLSKRQRATMIDLVTLHAK